MKTRLIAPTVHLNGTSKNELVENIRNAWHATRDAISALGPCTPHGRDYYVVGPDAYTRARKEHIARLRKLERVRDELLAIYEAIEDGNKETAELPETEKSE